MRLGLILPVLLIMVLPEAVGVVAAADSARFIVSLSHPAWPSIESPVLVMLGCILMGIAAWARKTLKQS